MENGSNPDHRFVDRVEETISVPSCRQFTKSELENWVDVSNDSVSTVGSSFRETAYLNNLSNGNGQNGVDEKEEGSNKTTIETQVTEQTRTFSSHLTNSSSSDQLERSVDHVETILDSEGVSRSFKVKDSKQSQKQTKTSETESFQEKSPNSESLSEYSEDVSETERELFFAGAYVQPFITVDPNDIFTQKSHPKQSVVWGDFYSRKQEQESHGSEQFEKIFQEQLNTQKEKELQEQKMMDKLLGTIPAYRGDWKQKETAEHSQVSTTSSEFSSDSLLVSGQEKSGGHASESHISAVTQEQVTAERIELETSAVDQSVDIKSLQKAILSQGSVVDPSKIIEVERKFIVTDNSEVKLKELGATLLSEKTFSDTYYDTTGYKLTLSDRWLRLRGNKWELKTPTKAGHSGAASMQFIELTDEQDIVKELRDTLALDSGMSKIKIQELVHIGLLSEFCHLTTTRKSYGLKSCSVDLDVTNFGFRVGEIEVIVLNEDRIPEALETIESVAKDLDFQPYAEGNLQVVM